ncbi:MAG: hypothetical protein J6Z12_04515 [Paludibacteraceae bacterium]|nr:hypothetical protein [Paludibacteraceae bacterium]
MTPDTPRYDQYEASLQTDLQLLCRQRGWLPARFIHTDDLEEKWKELAPEYLQDAVAQFNAYPVATLAWAAYIGIAEAAFWDTDWEANKMRGYISIAGEGGFDTLDENVVRNILNLPLDAPEATHIDDQLACLAGSADDRLRHEGAEPGSPDAFYLFTRTLRVLYRMGVALELHRSGYRWEEVR